MFDMINTLSDAQEMTPGPSHYIQWLSRHAVVYALCDATSMATGKVYAKCRPWLRNWQHMDQGK